MNDPFANILPSLFGQIAGHDERAFQELYHAYYNLVYRMAFKILNDEAGAEDAVQEVFIRLWDRREQLPAVREPGAYINTLTRRHLYNMIRREAVEDAYIRELLRNRSATDEIAQDDVQFRELETQVKTAINQLPAQQRNVFLLSRMEGYSREQIAAELQISPNTVKFHLTEALKSIRAYLQTGSYWVLVIGALTSALSH